MFEIDSLGFNFNFVFQKKWVLETRLLSDIICFWIRTLYAYAFDIVSNKKIKKIFF